MKKGKKKLPLRESLPMIYIRAIAYVFAPPVIMWFFLSGGTAFVLSFIYIIIAIPFTVYLFLAHRGICFVFAQENVATLIQCGGKFSGVVYSSRKLYVDEDFEVIERPSTKLDFLKKYFGGLTFYGINPFKDILYIDLKHNKLREKETDQLRERSYSVDKTTKLTSRIDLRITNYSMFFGEMETRDRNQIFVIMTVTLRVSNIYTFLKNRDPYGRLEEFLWAAFRNFIREFHTDELIGMSIGGEEKAIDSQVAMLGKEFFDYLAQDDGKTNVKIKILDNGRMQIEDLGFEIVNFAVLDIGLKDATAEEASKMLYQANKEREATIIRAEGDAAKVCLLAEVCQKYGIRPELQMLVEKMGVDQANYFFWQSNAFRDITGGPDMEKILLEILRKIAKGQS